MALNGIDISNHQKGLNLKDITCDFVICKATEGTTFVDKYCDGFMQQAMKLGKKVGVYHFASGKTTGKAEAGIYWKSNLDLGLGRRRSKERRRICKRIPGSRAGEDGNQTYVIQLQQLHQCL